MKILNPGDDHRNPAWFVGFIFRCRDCKWVFQLTAEDAGQILYLTEEPPFSAAVICPGCKAMISLGQSLTQVKDSERTKHP